MLRNKTMRSFIVGGLALLLISGCSWGANGNKEIDPPPTGADLDYDNDDSKPVISDVDEMAMTLYFKDANDYVVPVSVNVPETMTPAREALEYMVEDGPGSEWLPAGFKALLPKGTEILGIDIIEPEKLAIVDFSEEFASYNAQDERKIMEAVTWTLTQFDSIDKVKFWINGETMDEMPVDGTPMIEPLTRAMGVNLERADGVNLGQSSPVTLYFQSQMEDGKTYMVPVTRMIKRSDNIPLATLEALIAGPLRNGLSSVILPTAKVLDIEKEDQLITVNLDESVLNDDSTASSESLLSVVLSLTETTGAQSVRIKVEGSSKVFSSDGMDYNSPVVRPAHVNKIEL